MTPHTPATIEAALFCIPAALPRDEWARVGMALKSEMGPEGFELFDRWSAGAEGYRKGDARATWRSIKPGGGVTIGTLFALAKDHGFSFPKDGQAAPKPDPAALAELARKRQADEAAAEAERGQRQAQAAERARALWHRASEAGASPYLARKGVQAHGCRFLPEGVLLVPAVNAAGELVNVQRILPERPAEGPDKLFMKDARKAGTFHQIGSAEGAAWLLVAEGYATAASLHECTGRPVAVAWDAGNLMAAGRALRQRFKAARLAFCCDDDRATAERTGKNPGRDKATEAARACRGIAIAPEGLQDDETDFNDLHRRTGAAAVQAAIEAALQAADTARPRPAPAAPANAALAARQAPGSGDEAAPAAEEAPAGRQAPARRKAPAAGTASEDPEGDALQAERDLFRVDALGVHRNLPPSGNGDGGGWRRVCDPLHVLARARDAQGAGWALLLAFDTPDGPGKRWLMPREMLAGDGTAYRAALEHQGFATPVDTARRRWLTEYLASRNPPELVRLVDRTGWHGRAFVLHDETLGGEPGEPILFHGEKPAERTFAQRGALSTWQARIARPCIGNSRLAFSVAAAFAGPLVAWAGGDSGGFHFVGDSSCGKTTALQVAASVWGGPGYMQRWRGTDNGIEGLAAAHSDALLTLDELAQLDPKAAGEAAYMLGNGQGKARASRTGGSRPRLSWRLLFLSAGEVGLADHMAEAGKKARAGQELRLIDLGADAGRGLGLFDHAAQAGSPGELAKALGEACGKSYGSAGRAWLEHLAGRTDTLAAELRERMRAFEAETLKAEASGQVERVARRFALVAAAGEMASAAGLTGWPEGEAYRAARAVFDAWLAARPAGMGASEEEAMLRQVRGWFALNGEARFTDWNRSDDDRRPLTSNRAGWRRNVKSAVVDEVVAVDWFVLPEVFRTEVVKGWSERAVLRLLDRLGHLRREKGASFLSRIAPPGAGKVSAIRIRSTLLDEGGELTASAGD